MNYFTTHKTPIGEITLASDGKNLIGLWIKNQKHHGNTIFKEMKEKADLLIFNAVKQWIDRYFNGEKPSINELPLAPIGSEFRQAVWQILCGIPYGKVITYGEISQKIVLKLNKKKMASQAVGGAVGHNPISIIIPCHRVVGANGSLTGYASGLDIKIKLLELEKADMRRLFIPPPQKTVFMP
jgi:methylated-DNA-[protein]-cysteine S-methyltransferase